MGQDERPIHDPPADATQDFGRQTEALRRVARQLLRDQADRDDLIQETWLAHLEAGEGASRDASAWRRGVLRKKALKLWNRRQRRADVVSKLDVEAYAPAASAEIERSAIRDTLRRAIGELNPAEAEVIRARFFEDLSLKEICGRTGAPIGTVKSRLSRGLSRMREKLDARTGDPRLTGLALIRAFDWRREDTLPAAAGVGLGVNATFVWILGALATLGVVLVIALRSQGEAGPTRLAHPEDRTDPRAELASPPNGGANTSQGPARSEVTDPDAAEESAADEHASDPQIEPQVEPVDADMWAGTILTVLASDAVGAPSPDFHVGIWNGTSPTMQWLGPAGIDGRLEIEVTAEMLWHDVAAAVVLDTSRGPERDLVRLMPLGTDAAHGPSVYVPCTPGTNREVVIRLDQPRVALTGKVVDPGGRPIPGARVFSGGESLAGRYDGDLYLVDEPWNTIAANDGSFSFLHEQAGRNSLRVEAPGYSHGTWIFDSTGESTMELTLTLQPAATVAGIVRDAQGRPVEGASIFAEIQEFHPRNWAVSGTDGSYELSMLPTGDRRLWARASNYGPGFDELDSTRFVGRAGERLVWNPVLEPVEGICVEVVDADGEPISGQALLFRVQNDLGRYWIEQGHTGDDGRFTIYRDPGGPVYALLYGGSFDEEVDPIPYKAVRNLRPRADPYRVQLFESDLTFGSVRGRVIGHDGRPIVSSKLTVVPKAVGLYQDIPSTAGAFDVGKFPAGEYILRLESQRGGAWSRRFALAPGEDLDLGEMTTPPPGKLHIENRWPASAGGLDYRYVVGVEVDGFDEPEWVHDLRSASRLEGEYEVLPGSFTFTVKLGERTVQERRAVVSSGEAMFVELGPE